MHRCAQWIDWLEGGVGQLINRGRGRERGRERWSCVWPRATVFISQLRIRIERGGL